MESLNSSGDKSKLLSFEGMTESQLEQNFDLFSLKGPAFDFQEIYQPGLGFLSSYVRQ